MVSAFSCYRNNTFIFVVVVVVVVGVVNVDTTNRKDFVLPKVKIKST